jgi:hypothetical protein
LHGFNSGVGEASWGAPANGASGESSVRNLVARLRIEIGADRCQVMVPQTHPPAAETEVDFGEFTASIAGQVMKLYMFAGGCRIRRRRSISATPTKPKNRSWTGMCGRLRPSAGCRRDDPLRQFETGGDPDRVGPGTLRASTVRGDAIHYGYDSFFCTPGVECAHEKGGVEA